jgi:hypothetical protein
MNKDKVIELAMEEVGYTEGPNNLNKFAPIAGLANNLPWCNSFIAAIFIQAGLKQAIPITAAVASTEAWGLKNDRLVKLEEAKRGDLIIMDFTNSGRAQHIGLAINRYNPIKKTIHTVEGNTGEKSQANGEGVAYKTRSAKFIKCVVRPKYPKKQVSGAEIEGKKKMKNVKPMVMSWSRVFIAASLACYTAGVTDWKLLLNSGLSSLIPVILRWLDPKDTAYGRTSVK